jgi:Raf kinase inhibitor-like YbhB/YbcL family protein
MAWVLQPAAGNARFPRRLKQSQFLGGTDETAECYNGAKSLILIIDDPDAPDPKAPKMVWVHWVVYNLPPDTKSLPENAGKADLPQGTLVGLNDFKKTGYGGPCPPIGRHRYFHKLYAWIPSLIREARRNRRLSRQ